MPEHDNDRLEQFFRQAAGKPEISFNENDWKKLEARLDANDAVMMESKRSASRAAIATGVVLVLFFTAALWINYLYDFIPVRKTEILTTRQQQYSANPPAQRAPQTSERQAIQNDGDKDQKGKVHDQQTLDSKQLDASTLSEGLSREQVTSHDKPISFSRGLRAESNNSNRQIHEDAFRPGGTERGLLSEQNSGMTSRSRIADLRDERIFDDLIRKPLAASGRIEPKDIATIPDLKDADMAEAQSIGGLESDANQAGSKPVSNEEDNTFTPRLSVLLLLSPDFSSTSISRYSAPGKAFGAMIQYHMKSRWTFAAGVIKNYKQYTGEGEEYSPPVGYWKYYTNGRIPNNINGSCTVVEFPLMVQYTIRQNPRNRLHAGVGASSYLMLDESYQYIFDQPNPGAREGWTSRNSSRFLFNMINFTVAYEHQVLPGFMIGIEPYVKIPVEEIGWSNLKLFSTGASITMRYVLLRKKNVSIVSRSRGPD